MSNDVPISRPRLEIRNCMAIDIMKILIVGLGDRRLTFDEARNAPKRVSELSYAIANEMMKMQGSSI